MQYAYMQFTKDRNFLVDAEDRQRAAELSDTAPSEEKRIPQKATLSKENWLDYLDINRALKTARAII